MNAWQHLMRAIVVLTILSVLLAGCADDTPTGPAPAPAPAPGQDPLAPDPGTTAPGAEGFYETTTLEDGRFTTDASQCAPTGGLLGGTTSSASETLIHEVFIPDGTRSFEATYTRVSAPETIEPTEIHMYNPDQSVGGSAEKEVRFGSSGKVAFSVITPAKGIWSFTLVHCDVPESGQHVIDTLVVAEVPT